MNEEQLMATLSTEELILQAGERNAQAYHFAGDAEAPEGWYLATIDSSVFWGHSEGDLTHESERHALAWVVANVESEGACMRFMELEADGVTISEAMTRRLEAQETADRA